MGKDTTPKYWDRYTNLQHVKHRLIREYLNGWFPKVGLTFREAIYLDTHAGKGKHRTGESGSPVVAIETLLDHGSRERILQRCAFSFFFIEHDAKNVESLRACVSDLGPLPQGVTVKIKEGDFGTRLTRILDHFRSDDGTDKMPPAFVFVDPYGFKVPAEILSRLLAAGRVELFLNVIWRELDMAVKICQDDPSHTLTGTLNLVFGGDRWSMLDRRLSAEERAHQTMDLLREVYGGKWVTSMKMLGENRAARYLLAHFTNHHAGRDLMKDCMWKICPGGGFSARRSDSPHQIRLIEPEPDLRPLEAWTKEMLSDGAKRWSELDTRIRDELWRTTHLLQVIRKLRKRGVITATDYTGKFSRKADPLLSISEEE